MSSLSQYFTMQDVVTITSGKRRKWFNAHSDIKESGSLADTQLIIKNYYSFSGITLSGTGDSNLSLTQMMPKSWDGGPIRFRIGWHTTSANTGNVQFRAIAANQTASGETFGSGVGSAVQFSQAAPGAIDRFMLTDWSPLLTIVGWDENHYMSTLLQRFASQPTDTHESAIVFIGAEMEYTTNAPTDD